MSDYLGPNQTRVLDTEDRNFESITYQKRKPPLSSELDLGSKIDADRASGLTRFHIPSGFGAVGKILDAPTTMSLAAYEATLQAGDVVCSPSLVKNSFRLIAKDYGQVSERNEAIVNGNRVLVQGTNTADENNTIILNDPPTTGPRVDFVFLEVWRNLVSPTDPVYKYGNRDVGSTISNDLVDPAMGIETSLRIQLQYRIRVVGGDVGSPGIDIVGNPEGFDPAAVFVQGPLGAPNSTCNHAFFSRVPGDVGLWIAGPGDTDGSTESIIYTVDGYTYAIPMFAIRRRNSTPYFFPNPSPNTNGAGHDLAAYKTGIASDRPDNYYSDWIVAEDFVDLRHRVCAGENLKEICESTFRDLVGNRNRGVMVKSGLNEYGATRVQADSVNKTGSDPNGATHIAKGNGSQRIFSNAAMDQPNTFFIYPKTMGNWAYLDTAQINLSSEDYPTGSMITDIGGIYNKIDGNLTSDFIRSSIPTDVLTLTLYNAFSSINGTNRSIIVKCSISLPSGQNGLSQVPITFLQSMRNDSTCPQAMPDLDIRVRTAAPVIATDGTHFNMLRNHGGRITDNWNFGHQMIYHALGNGSSVFSVPKTHEGYDIIGIGDIRINNTDCTPSVFWNMSTNNYEITVFPAVASNVDIECTVYTSGKFFTGNKQGRAITDTFEMALLTSDEGSTYTGTTFHIDSGNREILRLGSYISDNGKGFGYDKTGNYYTLQNHNNSFPLDATQTYAQITFPTSVQGPVYVPVMLRSAIDISEGYSFFYKTVPYQGVLKDATTPITGHIEAVGSAITTSAGSGAITEFMYTEGQAQFNGIGPSVDGTNTAWSSYVRPGYVIRANADPTKEFLIKYVNSDVQIILDSPSYRSAGFENYTIVAKDQPSFNNANVIDIMPALDSDNDSTAVSNPLGFFWQPSEYDLLGERVLETRIIGRVQDIADLPANSMWIGQNPANRGRSRIQLPADLGKLGRGNLGLKYEPMSDTSSALYKKTYQSYILNKDNSGRLYLMIVGSETDNTSSFCFLNHASDRDVVDIFELSGRPILAKRIT